MKLNINGELGYELVLAAPFAYYQYLQGNILDITNAKDTSCFYPFANVNEEYNYRNPGLTLSLDDNILPEFSMVDSFHTPKLNTDKWCPPPYSSIYKNDYFRFEKPLLIISNKYNIEWSQNPINYLDLDTLDTLFKLYSNDYQIVYNRPLAQDITNDNSEVLEFNDHEFIKINHPEIKLIQDLQIESLTFNQLQMSLYANATKFISTQGGNSVLASYFGGTNIIFAKEGEEITNNSYNNWFSLLSCAEVIATDNYTDLINITKNKF